MTRERTTRAAAALAVWLGLWGLWLLLAGSASPAELVVGAAGAALVAAAAWRIARVAGVDLAPRPRWLAEVRHVPLDVLRDTVVVLRSVAGRPPPGSLARRRLPPVRDERLDRARAVALTVLLSVAPNSIVVGVEGGELVVHQLVSRPADVEVDLR